MDNEILKMFKLRKQIFLSDFLKRKRVSFFDICDRDKTLAYYDKVIKEIEDFLNNWVDY